MGKDLTAHDATTALVSDTFTCPKATKLVVTVKWTGIVGGGLKQYFLKQSNIDPVDGDPVPAIASGLTITLGSDSVTFEVTSPADKFEHSYIQGTASAGTIDVVTKIIYSND